MEEREDLPEWMNSGEVMAYLQMCRTSYYDAVHDEKLVPSKRGNLDVRHRDDVPACARSWPRRRPRKPKEGA